MKRWIPILVALTLLLTIGTTYADTSGVWRASYWNNKGLEGPPDVQKNEANLNFDWEYGSPDPAIEGDAFSARWTRTIEVPSPQVYHFTAVSDDGMRIWVGGNLVLNEWHANDKAIYNVDVSLAAGRHEVVVEYYEDWGNAIAKVTITPGGAAAVNWRGEYFNNQSLSGSPAMVRDDANIDFNWGTGSPAAGIVNADYFSVRWTRTLNLPPGNYRFTLSMDDGVRLWVNGHLLVDDWGDQIVNRHGGDIWLPGGNIPIRVEYYDHTGNAIVQLSWTQLNGYAPEPSPEEVIVDNGWEGFVRGGASSDWHSAWGWGEDMLWSYNNNATRTGYNWARWTPALEPGTYEVLAHLPAQTNATTRARYTISHAGGRSAVVINQNGNVARWASLGAYEFNGDDNEYVSLSDITGEGLRTRRVVFDAIKFELR